MRLIKNAFALLALMLGISVLPTPVSCQRLPRNDPVSLSSLSSDGFTAKSQCKMNVDASQHDKHHLQASHLRLGANSLTLARREVLAGKGRLYRVRLVSPAQIEDDILDIFMSMLSDASFTSDI